MPNESNDNCRDLEIFISKWEIEKAKLHHLQITFAYGISMWKMLK